MNHVMTAASATSFSNTERADLKKRYQHWRSVSRGLNDQLVRVLSKAEMEEGGRKLGILKRGVLVFDNEDDAGYLMDYCIHHVRTRGRSAIERELIARSDAPESDELTCLRAMQQSSYTLIEVESVEPGLGVHVLDLHRHERYFVTDLGFGNTAVPELVVATRIIVVEGVCMTGGAGIPFGQIPEGAAGVAARAVIAKLIPPTTDEFDPAMVIRQLLVAGRNENVRYQDVSSGATGEESIILPERTDKVRRNDLCPCGSGKKFKHCCLNSW